MLIKQCGRTGKGPRLQKLPSFPESFLLKKIGVLLFVKAKIMQEKRISSAGDANEAL